MRPDQPSNSPQAQPGVLPTQPQPQPQVLPGQVTPQIGMQPPAPQQPYGQPSYMGVPQQPAPNAYNNQYSAPGNSKKNLLFILIPAIIVVVAIIAFLVLGGAKQIVNKVAGIELENYSNTNFGFSMQVPKGWSAEERNEDFAKDVYWQEPAGDVKDQSEANKHYASIRVAYELADKGYLERSEQEYFDGIKRGLQQLVGERNENGGSTSDYVPEAAVVETEEMTSVNGLKAYKVKLKLTNFDGDKDGVGYEYGLFVYVDKNKQYELSLRAHESESINSKADSILTSFVKK